MPLPLATRAAALQRLLPLVAQRGAIAPADLPGLAASPEEADCFLAAGRVARGLGLLRLGPGGMLVPGAPHTGTLPLPCETCGLHRTSRAYCVAGTGTRDAEIACIGEGLGEEEEQQRRPFVGRAGQLLTRSLREADLRREEVWISNAVRCRPTTPRGGNRKPTSAEVAACQFFLLNELHALPRLRALVALGATAASALLEDALPPGGITEHQGKVFWSKLFACWVVVSIHPAYALRKPGEQWTLVQDLLLAKQIVYAGAPPQATTARYRLVTTYDQACEMRDAGLRAQRMYFDWETNGLHSLYARGFCLGVAYDEDPVAWVLPLFGSGMVPRWDRDTLARVRAEALLPLFRSRVPKVGHHVAFDANITRSTLGVYPEHIVGDTLLKHQVMWNHLPERAHSLKRLAVIYSTYGRYDDAVDQWLLDHGYRTKRGTPDMGHLWLAPDELVWPYNATDAVVTGVLDRALDAPLDAAGLRTVYEHERVPLARDYAEHDRDGLRINVFKLDETARDLAVARDLITSRLHQLVGAPLNINSPKQIQEYLYQRQEYPVLAWTETGQPSTREEHLLELARQVDDPVIHLILHGRAYGKLDGTYVTGREGRPSGFRAALDHDGRVRPDTLLHVIETFRLATRQPLAIHTIPRPLVMWSCPEGHGHYLFERCCGAAIEVTLNLRALIEPDPGYAMVIGDSVQQEYALQAIAAGQADLEAAMLDRGEDAHEYTMAVIAGRTKRDFQVDGQWVSKEAEAAYKQLRGSIKNTNFAIMYLGQAKTLVRTLARGTPPILITEEQAQETIDTWYRRFPAVREWQERKKQEVRATGRSRSLFGDTYRVLPQIASPNPFDQYAAERMACNFPIQEGGFRVMARAKIRLSRRWKEKRFPARVLFTVHDEIVAEALARPDILAEAEADMRACMEQTHPELVGGCGVPRGIRADIKVAASWGGEPYIERRAPILAA